MHRRAWQGAPARVGLRYDVLVEAGGVFVTVKDCFAFNKMQYAPLLLLLLPLLF
jgi:hypothetical protein